MVTQQQELIYQYIKHNPGCNTIDVVSFLGVDYRRPQININILRRYGYIRTMYFPGKKIEHYIDKRRKIE
jgi:hypothetical protein